MRYATALLASGLLLYGCGQDEVRFTEHVLVGETMGTTFSVKIVQQGEIAEKSELRQNITGKLAGLDRSLSTYKSDSELSVFNRNRSTDWVAVSRELCIVVDGAMEISRLTEGAFDVTVGPLVNLWGFGPDVRQPEPPVAEAIAAAMENVGYRKLETDCDRPALRKSVPGLFVDLSGFAKGYAVDRLAHILDEFGVSNYLVEVGGEIRLKGHNLAGNPWAIAIEKPLDDSRSVQTIVQVTNAAVATSGDYRNFFEWEGRRYSHTIDPKTGYPVTHNGAAVTIVTGSTAQADGLATGLLVLGPERGMSIADAANIAAYFLVRNDGEFEAKSSRAFERMTP